ncbi:hypothetical protein VTO42DRAFT_5370 [Malbranchea cinnamomea]
MWMRFVEAWLVTKLLSSPAFHRAVRRVHKTIHELRHGKAPEDMGGTRIDKPRLRDFFKYFREELKNQLRNRPTKM